MKLIFATRASTLALRQTQWVMTALQSAYPGLSCEEKIIATEDDEVIDQSSPQIGGKGLFIQELESELLSGAVHCVVHSLRDMPVEETNGLIIGCIPPREEVRDALISRDGYSLYTLPPGAVVGTSSLRRAAQVLNARPNLTNSPLYGNVERCLHKALDGQYHAIILTGAEMIRLGLESHVTEWLPLEVMLPAPGQGALAVQCRADDTETLDLLTALEDPHSRAAVTAERQFQVSLYVGFDAPVAAFAFWDDLQSAIRLAGIVASPDGQSMIRVLGQGTDPLIIGKRLAQEAIIQGAPEILALSADQGKL